MVNAKRTERPLLQSCWPTITTTTIIKLSERHQSVVRGLLRRIRDGTTRPISRSNSDAIAWRMVPAAAAIVSINTHLIIAPDVAVTVQSSPGTGRPLMGRCEWNRDPPCCGCERGRSNSSSCAVEGLPFGRSGSLESLGVPYGLSSVAFEKCRMRKCSAQDSNYGRLDRTCNGMSVSMRTAMTFVGTFDDGYTLTVCAKATAIGRCWFVVFSSFFMP